jgi:hypothetical protein
MQTLLLVLALAVGCSSKMKPADHAGTGGAGNAASGGSASGTGVGGGPASAAAGAGSGGSVPSGSGGNASMGGMSKPDAGTDAGGATSKTAACIEYATAEFSRLAKCHGLDDTVPLSGTSTCPDAAFAPGSTRTVAGLLACAQAWRTFPCDKVLRELLPDCATPGTRAPGESCFAAVQCVSLQCQFGTGTCGKCASTIPQGGDCTVAGAICDLGLRCMNGSCMPIELPSAPAMPAPVVTAKQTGETCAASNECVSGDFCGFDAPQNMAHCMPAVPLGQACLLGPSCTAGAFCDASSMTCRALPTAGQPCGDAGGMQHVCAPMLVCDMSTGGVGTCVARPRIGEACPATQVPCADAAAVCTCPTPGCSAKQCLRLVAPGEACTNPTVACHPGSPCQAGVCMPIDSQGLFEKACKP